MMMFKMFTQMQIFPEEAMEANDKVAEHLGILLLASLGCAVPTKRLHTCEKQVDRSMFGRQ